MKYVVNILFNYNVWIMIFMMENLRFKIGNVVYVRLFKDI